MACGDKYRYLLRTEDGLDADEPCKAFCNEADYSSWYDTIVALRAIVNKHWSELRNRELGTGDTSGSDNLVAGIAVFVEAVASLPEPWGVAWATTLASQKIDRAVSVGEMGCCELEKIDDAASDLGEELPEIHGPKAPKHRAPTLLESIQTVGVLAALGAGLYFIGRYAWRTRGEIGESHE